MTPRCNICGRYAKIVDVAIPFGNSNSVEPPDEIWFCATCARKCEEEAVEMGHPPMFWRKPDWSFRVADKLGYVEVASKGCAWTTWAKADAIPEGYSIVERESQNG